MWNQEQHDIPCCFRVGVVAFQGGHKILETIFRRSNVASAYQSDVRTTSVIRRLVEHAVWVQKVLNHLVKPTKIHFEIHTGTLGVGVDVRNTFICGERGSEGRGSLWRQRWTHRSSVRRRRMKIVHRAESRVIA